MRGHSKILQSIGFKAYGKHQTLDRKTFCIYKLEIYEKMSSGILDIVLVIKKLSLFNVLVK